MNLYTFGILGMCASLVSPIMVNTVAGVTAQMRIFFQEHFANNGKLKLINEAVTE